MLVKTKPNPISPTNSEIYLVIVNGFFFCFNKNIAMKSITSIKNILQISLNKIFTLFLPHTVKAFLGFNFHIQLITIKIRLIMTI